jgi:hypothetical protein
MNPSIPEFVIAWITPVTPINTQTTAISDTVDLLGITCVLFCERTFGFPRDKITFELTGASIAGVRV